MKAKPQKVDSDDLGWAKDWIDSFDPADDPDEIERKMRVLAWIEREHLKMEAKEANDDLLDRLAKATGQPKDKIRASKTFQEMKR